MSIDNDIWVEESPLDLTEGDIPKYSITYLGASEASSVGATIEIFKNGSGADIADNLCSGSITNNENILTLKTITFGSGTGGNDYTVVVTASIDGVTQVRKIMCRVQKKKTRQ